MSSWATSQMCKIEGVSDRQFRLLFWLCENCHDDTVRMDLDRLAFRMRSSIDAVTSEMKEIRDTLPGFGKLVIHDGWCLGVVDWDEAIQGRTG